MSTFAGRPFDAPAALPNPFETQPIPIDSIDEPPLMEALSQEIAAAGFARHPPNFPFCCPVVYHSISKEIPQKQAGFVRLCLTSAVSFCGALIVNVIAQFFSGRIESSLVPMWREIVMSVFALLVYPAVLLHAQYFKLYLAVRDDQPEQGIVLAQFVVIFVHFFVVIGVPGSGLIGVGYLVVAIRCGDGVTKGLAGVMTVWHFVNLCLQVSVLVGLVRLRRHGGRRGNPSDL
jgi:hypothetical protein